MKNVFKLLGAVAIACTMLAGMCTDEVTYKIKVKANPSEAGTVTGAGTYNEGATATLEAVPNAGYVFVDWEDGTRNNPRIVTVTADAEYTANFAEETGVKVTFGDNTWNAGYVNAKYYVFSNAIVMAAAQTTSISLPQLQFQNIWDGNVTTGTYQGSSTVTDGVTFYGPRLWYYETEDDFITINYSDGSSVIAGDWWDKTITLNVTAFDATAMTVSFVANATMGKVMDVRNGATWANATERAITLKVTGQTMTSTKGYFFNKEIAKISVR